LTKNLMIKIIRIGNEKNRENSQYVMNICRKYCFEYEFRIGFSFCYIYNSYNYKRNPGIEFE
jgi:hypothetical protein